MWRVYILTLSFVRLVPSSCTRLDGVHNSTLGADSKLRVSEVVKGEMAAKTTNQRSAKGPVSISECSADGKFLALDNASRKEEALGGWKIKRNIDGVDKIDYTFDKAFALKSGGKVKIWAVGSKPASAAPTDIESSLPSWGTGANINSKLLNPAGEERATHIQKTTYTA